LVTFDLPDTEYTTYQQRIERVTVDEVVSVAKETIKPQNATILVVGDRVRIEKPLKALPFVKSIQLLDSNGDPMPPSRRANDAAPASRREASRP